METLNLEDVNKALAVFLGKGTESYPKESEIRVIERYGDAKASQMMPIIKEVLNALGNVNPRQGILDLSALSNAAVEQISGKFPWLNQEGRKVLFWAYSWWNK